RTPLGEGRDVCAAMQMRRLDVGIVGLPARAALHGELVLPHSIATRLLDDCRLPLDDCTCHGLCTSCPEKLTRLEVEARRVTNPYRRARHVREDVPPQHRWLATPHTKDES